MLPICHNIIIYFATKFYFFLLLISRNNFLHKTSTESNAIVKASKIQILSGWEIYAIPLAQRYTDKENCNRPPHSSGSYATSHSIFSKIIKALMLISFILLLSSYLCAMRCSRLSIINFNIR